MSNARKVGQASSLSESGRHPCLPSARFVCGEREMAGRDARLTLTGWKPVPLCQLHPLRVAGAASSLR